MVPKAARRSAPTRRKPPTFRPAPTRRPAALLLAQAGTGIGKTLGYLAPASLWAQQSGGTVWVSTFTKALQRQLRRESRRAWDGSHAPMAASRWWCARAARTTCACSTLRTRCKAASPAAPRLLAQLVARWAAYSQDGDMIGGDLPGWLGTLFRQRGHQGADRPARRMRLCRLPALPQMLHRTRRRASAQADLVIANHALVMVNAARGRDTAQRPTRIVFDEGHHVFEAADSTFAAALTGAETIELRRWVIGPERGSKGRRRGLSARLADLASYDEAGGKAIAAARDAAEALPGDGWLQRLAKHPSGPLEELLAAVRAPSTPATKAAGRRRAMALKPKPRSSTARSSNGRGGAGRAGRPAPAR
jgi:ATP-dependent DNA helicase DinG